MTDLEIYNYWAEQADLLDQRQVCGSISPETADRLMRNLEERLGIDKWSVVRWHRAMNAWHKERGA